MNEVTVRFVQAGYLYIDQQDELDFIVSIIGSPIYEEEFCVSMDFSPSFIANLMAAGFLVMSAQVSKSENEFAIILMPKHHLIRNVLFFDNLHISKSIKS